MEQYGENDKWVKSLIGDCEDYALYAQDVLYRQGIKADMWIVITETNEFHVVLVVGDSVIDNRYNDVMSRHNLEYQWIGAVKYYNDKLK
jgi:predicted transglutaminase-like cysteine proteinase